MLSPSERLAVTWLKFREVSPLLWIVGALFVAYFALNPIQQALKAK